MKIPQRVRNILFDMDDVLVLTRALDREAKEEVFAPLGLNWVQIRPYADLVMREMVPRMFKSLNINTDYREYTQKYFEKYNRLLAEKIRENTVPGAVELVKKLFAQKYNLALVSGSTSEQVKIICQGLGVGDFFRAIVTIEEVTHGKPHPEPYQKAIEKLGAKPEECLVIENFPVGVASAKAVHPNIFVIAITTTNSRDDLKGADFIIDSLKEIETREE